MRCPIWYLMSRTLLYSLYEDFQNSSLFTTCLNNQYIGLCWRCTFFCVWTLPHSEHYHSSLHEKPNKSLSFSTAHPCPSQTAAVGDRKMLLLYWSPVDRHIFYYIILPLPKTRHTRTFIHTGVRKPELWWKRWWVHVCGCVSTCMCVECVYAKMCVCVCC